jgi:diadenosine tetraphosphate (Ap4A) HIT family hydrolase
VADGEVRAMTGVCSFCRRISRGEYDKKLPGWSFEPLDPVTPGHRLFVSSQHVTDAAEDWYTTGRVFSNAADYARREGVPFNLITSAGSAATQTVFHFHVHYLPRSEGDGLLLPWSKP